MERQRSLTALARSPKGGEGALHPHAPIVACQDLTSARVTEDVHKE
jgi:hypothetical protein